jgi:hypothetical protein
VDEIENVPGGAHGPTQANTRIKDNTSGEKRNIQGEHCAEKRLRRVLKRSKDTPGPHQIKDSGKDYRDYFKKITNFGIKFCRSPRPLFLSKNLLSKLSSLDSKAFRRHSRTLFFSSLGVFKIWSHIIS